MKRKRADVFGPYCDYIRNLACLACDSWPSEPHHVKSRGAGGTDFVGYGSHGNVVPLCATCHSVGHSMGWQSFERATGIDLECEAERLYRIWCGE